MIKIRKKQLSNLFLVFSFVILPAIFVFCFKIVTPLALVVFYCSGAFSFLFLFASFLKKKNETYLRALDLQERVNILKDQTHSLEKGNLIFRRKIERYSSLKNILEKINQNLAIDFVASQILQIVFDLIAGKKGNCLLYLIDTRTQSPVLFKSTKEDNRLIIKHKEGDIFDLWVLRHNTSLLVEDTKKDFRFDIDKLESQDSHLVASLISSPLISANRMLGILRLESRSVGAFTQDDLRFLAIVADIAAVALEEGELFQKTQELAIHDGLTSLFTKGYFLERLAEESKRALRNKSALSLLMLDIDFFKHYNDKFGHTAGDIVLKKLAQKLSDCLAGPGFIISRFGGEEFCVACIDCSKKEALKLAEELRKNIENMKVTFRRQETNVTISLGVATLPQDAADGQELIRLADRACLEAKQKGRNRVIGV